MMKNSLTVLFTLCILLLGCNDAREPGNGNENHSVHQEHKQYTCPMHSEVINNGPGQCPKCGMDLLEKAGEGQSKGDKGLEFLLKPTNQFVVSQVNTISPLEKELDLNTMAMGTIGYDQRQINTVSAKVSGWVEKLYIKYRFQPVIKGQKIMDIYSRDLETEQQNLLFLLKNDAENKTLIKASVRKLVLLGLTTEQINQLKSSDKIFKTITVYSPYSGHLHDLIPLETTDGMGADSYMPVQELQIREGMYVSKGQTIFNIYDTHKVWALLSIYPDARIAFKRGQKVSLEINGLKDIVLEASVDFIEPAIRENQKSITARIYLNNPSNEIKIGANVKAKPIGVKLEGLFVPSTSIVSLGLQTVVFAKIEGSFRPVIVETGKHTGEWVEILSGLSKNDSIAQYGQLLMDSESFIKTEN